MHLSVCITVGVSRDGRVSVRNYIVGCWVWNVSLYVHLQYLFFFRLSWFCCWLCTALWAHKCLKGVALYKSIYYYYQYDVLDFHSLSSDFSETILIWQKKREKKPTAVWRSLSLRSSIKHNLREETADNLREAIVSRVPQTSTLEAFPVV